MTQGSQFQFGFSRETDFQSLSDYTQHSCHQGEPASEF